MGKSCESIGFSNKRSRNGKVKLDFDANAGTIRKSPVENITLDETTPGIYKVFVNNYNSRGGATIIPFTLVVNLDGEISTFESEWNRSKMADNCRSNLIDMMHITTVDITSEMIGKAHGTPTMSTAQSKRYSAHEDGFESNFGEITSKVVNMSSTRLGFISRTILFVTPEVQRRGICCRQWLRRRT